MNTQANILLLSPPVLARQPLTAHAPPLAPADERATSSHAGPDCGRLPVVASG